MDRRSFLMLGGLASGAALMAGCRTESPASGRVVPDAGDLALLRKTPAEWSQLLPPAAFSVLFQENTERPFSSSLNDEKREGTYLCAACFLPLFSAKTKFDSGTGWPSFYEPMPNSVGTREDRMLIFPRTEYHCARCGGHQGHVFDDGPKPTGQRWCNNGVALAFFPAGEPLPPLRT
jgi:peptide-methionine (R)-S-oxide reductase